MGSSTTGGRAKTRATAVRVSALVLAMVAVSGVTLQRSQSAFSGTTNYGGEVTSATVSLESKANANLNVPDMVPGDSIVRCVDVTYTGTATADQLESVRIYAKDTAAAGSLAPHLQVQVGLGAAGADCGNADAFAGADVGTLANAYGTASAYTTAADSYWIPAGHADSRRFRFVVTMPQSVGNEAQGKTTSPQITWEIRTKAGKAR